MPLYSCFTPFGHLVYSSRPSHGELIYRQIVGGWSGNYSTMLGSATEAWAYATAMLLARVRYAKERAANQMDPHTVEEMLPVREKFYGLIPGRTDTETDRRRALEAKYKLPQGASYAAVNAALVTLLGSDFLYFYVTKRAGIETWPINPVFGAGLFNDPRLPAKWVRITDPVATIGTPVAVHYEPLDPNASTKIEQGETVCLSANNIGLAEKAIVASATPGTFTVTLANAHDAGDVCTTGYFPFWLSTRAHALVIVKPSVANSAEKKRKVHALMTEILQGWVSWDICPSTDGLSTDAFTVGGATLGRIGYAGIGAVPFP